MKTPSHPQRRFSALTIQDLLEAREHYHVHLANLENVVATAIGRYRIRRRDADATRLPSSAHGGRVTSPGAQVRTLANSVVTDWSWPCVLVFVSKWMTPSEFARKPDQAVPRFLYLPDGRIVATCVVLAETASLDSEPLGQLKFPDQLMGGGFPVLTEVQGGQHVGSIGCLVSDGSVTYALTNLHVAGATGSNILALIDGERRVLGTASGKQIAKLPIGEAHPGYPGNHAVANLDAALIRVDDVNEWTAQVFGIGEIGDPVDLNLSNLSLDLIGRRVRAFGGASGAVTGEVQALFYRYRSLGGLDYITDFLIGAPDGQPVLGTKRGDSGTIWFLEAPVTAAAPKPKRGAPPVPAQAPVLRPLALQWGGHRTLGSNAEGHFQFALASNLSAICRLLDVQIVRDWNHGLPETWGQVGHYKIGFLACQLVSDPKLKKFLTANADRVGISDDGLRNQDFQRLDKDAFVPLADVPDEIWRSLPDRKADDSNHFADMDEEGKGEFAGKTLLDLAANDANLTVQTWNKFYASIGAAKRGAVPFRIWQIYDEMTGFLRAGRVDRFLCAAGIMAHYVGDCGQPLHISKLHHGRPDHKEDKVHTAYETTMLSRYTAELITGVAKKLHNKSAAPQVHGGRGAALGLLQLMKKTVHTLPPMDVIDAFNAVDGRERIPHMWEKLGDRTMTCIAQSALYLATIWESAWAEGGGGNVPATKLVAVPKATLRKLYMDKAFIRSYTLRQLEDAKILH